MAIGDTISATDYNTIRNKIIRIVGTGDGNRGYGQSINSSAVSSGNIVTKSQYDLLRFDIYNALFHQTGSIPAITTVAVDSVIRFGASHPNTQYDTLSNTADTNRFDIGTGQSAVEPGTSATFSSPWSNQLTCVLTVTFSTAEQARFFFNSGGKIRFSSTRSGGVTSDQNASWTQLLSSVGTQAFGGNTPAVNYFALTTAYQNWFTSSPGSSFAYISNTLQIDAKCEVANNVNGTGRVIDFRIRYIDSYTDPGPPAPGDSVDGTFTLTVDQIRAVGTLQPAGSFTVVGPSNYSAGTFTSS
jgi:hypothetical protein